jgi:hypothetical protein
MQGSQTSIRTPPTEQHVREHIRISQYALGLSPLLLFCPGSGILTQVAQDTQIMVFACLGTKPAHFSSSEQSIWLSIVALALGRKIVSQVIADAEHSINTALQQSHWSDVWFKINRQFHSTPNQQESSSAAGDLQSRAKRSTRKRKQQPTVPPAQRSKRRRGTQPEWVDPTPATQLSDHVIDCPRSSEPRVPPSRWKPKRNASLGRPTTAAPEAKG